MVDRSEIVYRMSPLIYLVCKYMIKEVATLLAGLIEHSDRKRKRAYVYSKEMYRQSMLQWEDNIKYLYRI